MRENTNKHLLGELGERRDLISFSNLAFSFPLPIKIKSVYEWRILGLIILKMQADFGDHKFDFKNKKDLIDQKQLLDSIRMEKLGYFSGGSRDIDITFPLIFLLNRDRDNMLRGYENVKSALNNLSRIMEYENKSLRNKLFDKSDKSTGIVWGRYQLIEKAKIEKVNGISYVSFRVPDETWHMLCRWEKGVHIAELSVFFLFNHAISVPFYIFLADYRNKGEIILTTNQLKDLLAPGKYRDYSSFKNRVLEPIVEDFKTYSPFYIEIAEYVNFECTIPAGKGRGKPANYVKIKILYQAGKNLAVDERIDMFLEMNKLSSFHIEDLTKEELNFLSNNLGFKEIKGKNLETIVKLKYYKNYGHDAARNNWRTNPGNFFMLYLKRLYDTIMLSDKPVSNTPAYAITSMQEALAGYEPIEKTPEQIQEEKDAPKAIAK